MVHQKGELAEPAEPGLAGQGPEEHAALADQVAELVAVVLFDVLDREAGDDGMGVQVEVPSQVSSVPYRYCVSVCADLDVWPSRLKFSICIKRATRKHVKNIRLSARTYLY